MDNNTLSKEDLSKLENEAYFELCQIIAEALELQDIELLDARIYEWKSKYKKLLDGSTPNSNFKKRIEYLLNQYYSEVTQYIFKQIKFKEQVKIENQSKALSKLYSIIKETNDLDLLRKKVKEWESKYPKSAFLRMYRGKVDLYTSDKYLKDNALDQKEAFEDWCTRINRNFTFDEFKEQFEEWSKLYSIGDKYSLDDFVKNQTEIKRYTSDEYLQSISKYDPVSELNISSKEKGICKYSPEAEQSSAYASLLNISNNPNNVDEMFKWIYKNSSLKFNDKYKELILSATYLNYSPTYLKEIKVPELNLNDNSLSYAEYLNMNDIKKYAIISYFNLLLPPDKAIKNNCFDNCINNIYKKSESYRHIHNHKQEDIILKEQKIAQRIKENPTSINKPEQKINETVKQTTVMSKKEPESIELSQSNPVAINESNTENSNVEISENTIVSNVEPKITETSESKSVVLNNSNIEDIKDNDIKSAEPVKINHEEILVISPLVFYTINNKVRQSVIVDSICEQVDTYVEKKRKIATKDYSKKF